MDACISVKVALLRTVSPLAYHRPDVFFYNHHHYYDFTLLQHIDLDVKTAQIMSGHRMAGGGWMGFCSISSRSNLLCPELRRLGGRRGLVHIRSILHPPPASAAPLPLDTTEPSHNPTWKQQIKNQSYNESPLLFKLPPYLQQWKQQGICSACPRT